jgi:site-specific DNA recombinase
VKVALYARVSTERQQERRTISSQLEALRTAAETDGHEVIKEFCDDGYSGARLDRPALDRLRDAAEVGVFDGVICLAADRLARVYAYQVLIIEELERFGVSVRCLEGPAHGEDPQATLLVQMQGVIAEYERAKIAERYRRGKLYRARQGEIPFWKTSYGHRRVVPGDGGPARIEIVEPEAEIVPAIFDAHVEQGRSIRQISLDLLDRAVPSPTGKPVWGTSTITRLLNNEAYIGTVYYNRRESLEGHGPRGARDRKTRHRERPREEWIAIPVPAIIDQGTFDRVKQISRDNSKWNPRGAEWGVWLLRGLIECGHCHLGCNCHRMRGRNGTWHRYYYCRGHDVLRARSTEGRCPERNIRADELDTYVWAQVRQVLLDPRQLLAGEHAVIAGAPSDENDSSSPSSNGSTAPWTATSASAPAVISVAWSPRRSERCSTPRTRPTPASVSGTSSSASPPWPRRSAGSWRRPRRTSSPSTSCPLSTGPSSAALTRWSVSTRRSAAAPTSSGSSPTTPRDPAGRRAAL